MVSYSYLWVWFSQNAVTWLKNEILSSKKEYGIDICKEYEGGGGWRVLGTTTIKNHKYLCYSFTGNKKIIIIVYNSIVVANKWQASPP